MWLHTPSRDILILVSTVAPAELLRVMTSFGLDRTRQRRLGRAVQGGVLTVYAGVTTLALMALELSGTAPAMPLAMGNAAAIAAAAVVGVLAFCAEYLLGAMSALAVGGRPCLRANTAGIGPDLPYLMSILLVAAVEEVLYRGIWLGVLRASMHWASPVAVLVCAAGYAAGHLFFGGLAVVQKFASGLLFGMLMVATGSLVAPIVAHACLNAIVFAIARAQRAPA
jgi:membrane protease YdiL (CAAX protease family)